MALQDLTPQLRTRLSRVERVVGWFVFLATALLIFGFGYYVYKTAQRKGWFIPKITYRTSLNNATGLKVGDHVQLMGFDVGEITQVEANDPSSYYGVTISFDIRRPYYGYLWSDSTAKVAGADLFGKRSLEITKGVGGVPTVLETTNHAAIGLLQRNILDRRIAELVEAGTNRATALQILNTTAQENPWEFYAHLTPESHYWLNPDESPALTERLEKLVNEFEQLVPVLTNKISIVLDNSVQLTSNLTVTAVSAQSVLTNVNSMIGDAKLLIGNSQVIITNFGGVSETVNAELPKLFDQIGAAIFNLADITSNLNAQVQSNTNILSSISQAVIDTDNFVQGLKHHWLLRSAFKNERKKDP